MEDTNIDMSQVKMPDPVTYIIKVIDNGELKAEIKANTFADAEIVKNALIKYFIDGKIEIYNSDDELTEEYGNDIETETSETMTITIADNTFDYEISSNVFSERILNVQAQFAIIDKFGEEYKDTECTWSFNRKNPINLQIIVEDEKVMDTQFILDDVMLIGSKDEKTDGCLKFIDNLRTQLKYDYAGKYASVRTSNGISILGFVV